MHARFQQRPVSPSRARSRWQQPSKTSLPLADERLSCGTMIGAEGGELVPQFVSSIDIVLGIIY